MVDACCFCCLKRFDRASIGCGFNLKFYFHVSNIAIILLTYMELWSYFGWCWAGGDFAKIGVGINCACIIMQSILYFVYVMAVRAKRKHRVLTIRLLCHSARFIIVLRLYWLFSNFLMNKAYTSEIKAAPWTDDTSHGLDTEITPPRQPTIPPEEMSAAPLRGLAVKITDVNQFDGPFNIKNEYVHSFCPFGSLFEPYGGYTWDGEYVLYPLEGSGSDYTIVALMETYYAMITFFYIVSSVAWSSYASVLHRMGTGLERKDWLTLIEPSFSYEMITYESSSRARLIQSLENESLERNMDGSLMGSLWGGSMMMNGYMTGETQTADGSAFDTSRMRRNSSSALTYEHHNHPPHDPPPPPLSPMASPPRVIGPPPVPEDHGPSPWGPLPVIIQDGPSDTMASSERAGLLREASHDKYDTHRILSDINLILPASSPSTPSTIPSGNVVYESSTPRPHVEARGQNVSMVIRQMTKKFDKELYLVRERFDKEVELLHHELAGPLGTNIECQIGNIEGLSSSIECDFQSSATTARSHTPRPNPFDQSLLLWESSSSKGSQKREDAFVETFMGGGSSALDPFQSGSSTSGPSSRPFLALAPSSGRLSSAAGIIRLTRAVLPTFSSVSSDDESPMFAHSAHPSESSNELKLEKGGSDSYSWSDD